MSPYDNSLTQAEWISNTNEIREFLYYGVANAA